MYPDNPNAAARVPAYQNDIAAAGLVADPIIKVSVTESNYVGVATQMKNAGDDSFITVLEFNGISKLAQAIKQVGWTPKAPYYGAQAYGPQVPQLAGDAANGALIGLTHDIVEGGGADDADVRAVLQGEQLRPAARLLRHHGLDRGQAVRRRHRRRRAGTHPRRRDRRARTVTSYTAGTILAPRDPAGKHSPTQFVIVTIEGGQWKRVYPDAGLRVAMTTAVDWFKGIRTNPARGVAVVARRSSTWSASGRRRATPASSSTSR